MARQSNIRWERLAQTPPMGWNSWNPFGANVSEQVIRETADAFIAHGLKDAGYEYVVIDDHWHGGRDAQGRLFPDAARFPSGMKALADYVHGRGLKFGMYSDAGIKTCGGRPGSHRHEELDAQTFAAWDVDFLKYDYCYAPDNYRVAIRRYTRMGAALKAAGRPILFSACEWGQRAPWLWARAAGAHMWRVTYDVHDLWDSPHSLTNPVGIACAIDAMSSLDRCAGPGGWNDPDMLVVGLKNTGFIKGGGCTPDEYRTQFSMWCMLAAPLMLGCDVRNMDDATQRIVTHKEIIAIDQDALGKQGRRLVRRGIEEVWLKPLAGGRAAVALLNRGDRSVRIEAQRDLLDLAADKAYAVRNVWARKDAGRLEQALAADVAPHACEVFVLTPAA